MKKEFDVLEFMNREFYIVDCKNFMYYPRKVRVIGFEIAYGEGISFEIDVPETYCPGENRKMYKEELERFNTFDEARKYAEKLNEIPENKKRAEDWNNSANQYRMLLMEQEYKTLGGLI